MKKLIVQFLILFMPMAVFGQDEQKKVVVSVGAENEIIPEIGDTIKVTHYKSEKIKELKYRDENSFYKLELDEEGNKIKLTENPLDNLYNSTVTKFSSSGVVLLRAHYKKGIVNGDYETFHENGNPKISGAYIMMRKDGIWKYYGEDGNLAKEEKYEDGKLMP